MPIRVCALPFEHFMLWWYHYGNPFFISRAAEKRGPFKLRGVRQYTW
jgi:hypothetical protein